jgi:hypothetical protein
MFHWVLAGSDDGAAVDVCANRACTNIVTTFSSTGTSGAPAEDLAPGVYFWRLHGTEGSLTGAATSAVWQLTVPPRNTPVNTSWGTTLDINGDGFADVVAGGTALDAEGGGAGSAKVYLGGAAGLSTTPAFVLNDVSSVIGTPVASASDVNGDGFGDLIVAAPGASSGDEGNVGQFWVYFGSAAGLTAAPAIVNAPTGDLEFGNEPVSLGDVNGDGYGDVMVLGVNDEDKAVLYVYLGSPNGPVGSPLLFPTGPGQVSSTAIDINGDGFSDFVTAAGGVFSGDSGTVQVYYGTATGLSATPVTLSFTGTTSTGFDLRVEAAGDVNGDGFGDVLVSLPDIGTGTVDLYLGSAAGLSASPIVIPNLAMAPYFGDPAAVGDINADGFDDAMFEAAGFPTGTVYVFLGGALGLPTAPTGTITPPAGAAADFGEVVAGAGDINGDGFDDVLVGASAYEAAGTVYVYSGGATGLSSNPASFATMFDSLE